MPGDEDIPANRRQSDAREPADRSLEEMLRQIGADILDEPVPERLRRVLRRQGGEDGGDRPDHPQSGGEPARRRDDHRRG